MFTDFTEKGRERERGEEGQGRRREVQKVGQKKEREVKGGWREGKERGKH